MLRLNMSIAPVGASPNRLGVLGRDLQGFPNGRRLTDDVVDIACRRSRAPRRPASSSSALAAGDGVDANDNAFGDDVPVRRTAERPARRRPGTTSTAQSSEAAALVAPGASGTGGTAPVASVLRQPPRQRRRGRTRPAWAGSACSPSALGWSCAGGGIRTRHGSAASAPVAG